MVYRPPPASKQIYLICSSQRLSDAQLPVSTHHLSTLWMAIMTDPLSLAMVPEAAGTDSHQAFQTHCLGKEMGTVRTARGTSGVTWGHWPFSGPGPGSVSDLQLAPACLKPEGNGNMDLFTSGSLGWGWTITNSHVTLTGLSIRGRVAFL